MAHLELMYLLKVVIFHGYVSLPAVKSLKDSQPFASIPLWLYHVVSHPPNIQHS